MTTEDLLRPLALVKTSAFTNDREAAEVVGIWALETANHREVYKDGSRSRFQGCKANIFPEMLDTSNATGSGYCSRQKHPYMPEMLQSGVRNVGGQESEIQFGA